MENLYFSEREAGARPRIEEEISPAVWGGIVATTQAFLADESFGASFPEACDDGQGVAGANTYQFSLALAAEVSGIVWPLDAKIIPDKFPALDFLEFCHQHVAKPIQGSYHSFFRHYHLTFDREAGQDDFRQRINRIFGRNGIAYELNPNGQIIRLAPEGLREALQTAVFRTGDSELDSLLETSRTKFLSPDTKVRREALEKLWDAWERLKTIEPGADKKDTIKALLDKTSKETNFRDMLEREAKDLTTIGNTFQIRHSEKTQTPVQNSEHIDYLFHRLFAMIRMLIALRSGATP